MIDSIFRRLRGKKILIAGFGREGKSTLNFLSKYLVHAVIGVADKNESALQGLDSKRYNLYYGDDYLEAASDYDIGIKTPGISVKDINIDESKISSQTDLFLEAFNSQTIGITGTKGKSASFPSRIPGGKVRKLLSETESLDNCSVSLDILLHKIGKELLSVSYHLRKTSLRVEVLGVLLHVLGKLVDSGCKNSDLYLGRTGISLIDLVLFDKSGLCFLCDHCFFTFLKIFYP